VGVIRSCQLDIILGCFFSFLWCRGSGIRGTQRRSIDLDRDAMMLQTIQESIHQLFALKELVPIRVAQIGGDDGGDFGVAMR
jgi:hypothetical protein